MGPFGVAEVDLRQRTRGRSNEVGSKGARSQEWSARRVLAGWDEEVHGEVWKRHSIEVENVNLSIERELSCGRLGVGSAFTLKSAMRSDVAPGQPCI